MTVIVGAWKIAGTGGSSNTPASGAGGAGGLALPSLPQPPLPVPPPPLTASLQAGPLFTHSPPPSVGNDDSAPVGSDPLTIWPAHRSAPIAAQ
jgi:hypothetical protein